eukprot:scaffold999_cov88-Skeletonema_dohrnii-CCMP3373.AAC.1
MEYLTFSTVPTTSCVPRAKRPFFTIFCTNESVGSQYAYIEAHRAAELHKNNELLCRSSARVRGEGIHAAIGDEKISSQMISLVEQQVITALMAGMMVSLNIDLDVHGIVSERHSKYIAIASRGRRRREARIFCLPIFIG